MEELSQLLAGPARVVAIAQRDLDLKSLSGENNVVILKMVEGSLAAGGRGGGLGERRVVMVAHYRYADGACEKILETRDEKKAARFEVPYYVSRIPLILLDGTQSMGYGVVEEELVRQMIARLAEVSSA